MRLCLSLLVGAGWLFIAPAQAAFTLPETEDAAGVVSTDIVAETELYCMTLGIYFEGGSTAEPEIGQRHIARVILERAKANRSYWGGRTICGVVFYKRGGVCQFSFACLPTARRTPRKGPAWEFSKKIAVDTLAGRNESPDGLIRYYMNSDLTPAKNACRFRKEFVPVIRAGRHDFFREASSWERRELARTNPVECQRYEAMLQAKKRKSAKKLAKGRAPKKATKLAGNQ